MTVQRAQARWTRALLGMLAVLLSSSCAIRWYDRETGTEHVFGLTHVKVRRQEPQEETRAVARQITTLGAALTVSGEDPGLVLGWNRACRLVVLDEHTSVRLEWPTTSLFDVRVGALPPDLVEAEETESNEEGESE